MIMMNLNLTWGVQRSRRLTALVAALLLAGFAASADAAPKNVKKILTLDPWHVTRAMPAKSLGEVLFAEQLVDLKAKDTRGRLLWTAQSRWIDGKAYRLRAGKGSSIYLFRTIAAKEQIAVTGSFGSGDGCMVWLNGKRIVTADATRDVAPDQNKVKLQLRKGENQLLVKVHNKSGKSGFFFRITELTKLPAPRKRARPAKAPITYVTGGARVTGESLRRAIVDLSKTYPKRYAKGSAYLARLDALEKADKMDAEKLAALANEALLANPLMDFDKLMILRRGLKAKKLGLPQNWQGNCAIGRTGYDDEITVLSPVSSSGKLTTLFKPTGGEFVGDIDLNFDGKKMLFSMQGSHKRWQIWEVGADGKGLRQVTPGEHTDVDNYDACYLPNGRIMFDSTRCFHGVPCVGGNNTVANLHIMDADGKNIRQLCFDQDHDWCPTVLNNGRILYSRWEYSDSPHYFTRLLFHMNPDGTNQMEYYASNSNWPNSTFYARPIPGHPTKVVAVISGHHGVPRMGELVIFDPAAGRHEASGAVQRIPGYGKVVKPITADGLVNGSWPKFLHPYPLSGKYFLVSSQPTSRNLWGVYLVDIFDNMVLLKELSGNAMFEPVPLRKTTRPPIVPSKVNLATDKATVYMTDVYAGRGLTGVPRGTVKKLRIYEFHYAYPKMGGHINIGIDGPWDVHRILGTVPVKADGSAMFTVPANTPLAVQPLDKEGKAVQVMRSWLTAMPGETLSCVGCHENQNTTPALRKTLATLGKPSEITPWYGPTRGFSFKREVQPVLDKYCAGCHNGKAREDGKKIPNFADIGRGQRGFTNSYLALHPYVRRPGPESDYHLQKPGEWHADTSELIQMLTKGHNNVKLDAEAWDRLITWIDLNVPDHGTWGEHRKIAGNFHKRRLEMRTLYANRPEDPEKYPTPAPERGTFIKPAPMPQKPAKIFRIDGWPFDAAEAKRRQDTAGPAPKLKLDLGEGLAMDLVLIPAGKFLMGDIDGHQDEWARTVVAIDKAFYMGKFEVTNALYKQFDSAHDSAYISEFAKDQSKRGQPVNGAAQPVVRISWQKALEFCEWLSQKTGRKFSLPTEAQWEYACRAGTASAMNYGPVDADFGKLANLADQRVVSLCRKSPKWIPYISSVNDGAIVTATVGKYAPNAWGLHDMHGNVAEWTQTTYKPYPYNPRDERDKTVADGRKVIRGGSFYDRPKRGRSGFRLAYPSWRVVFNVGFRVICEVKAADKTPAVAAGSKSK